MMITSEPTTTDNPSLEDPRVFQQHQDNLGIDVPWLTSAKQSAWSRYLELPSPLRTDEKWRFANLNRIREMGDFRPVPGTTPEVPGIVERSRRFNEVSGRLVLADEALAAAVELDPDLRKQGVIFTTLADAIVQHPDLVQRYFMQQTPELGSEKFEALHVALLRNGTFLYVPDDVEIDRPFVSYNWSCRDGGALFPHTLFITGRNARASLIEFQEAATEETRHLVVANAHLYAGDGARPVHTIVQNWNLNTLSFQLNTNNAQEETVTKSTLINLGSIQARQEIHGKIFGSGSNVEMYALNVPRGRQEFDQRTLQSHIAPRSRSDLLFKNALMESSRSIFSGLIIVEEDAQQTDAYQTNNNLMLSDKAEANSLPGLEIKANDVKCSHGATTGRIDESEIFYFLARGIPRSKAQELMVFGYFEEIVQKLDNAELAEYIRERLVHKFTD
ncbi:MAG: SufD family Fe-S cluster assembly protein [Oceanipulchritudo sp.]